MNAIHSHWVQLSQLSQFYHCLILIKTNVMSFLVYWQFMDGCDGFDGLKGD